MSSNVATTQRLSRSSHLPPKLGRLVQQYWRECQQDGAWCKHKCLHFPRSVARKHVITTWMAFVAKSEVSCGQMRFGRIHMCSADETWRNFSIHCDFQGRSSPVSLGSSFWFSDNLSRRYVCRLVCTSRRLVYCCR